MCKKKVELTCMTRKENEFIKKLKVKSEKEFVRNPYTGCGTYLAPVQVAVYDYIMGCEALGNHGEDFKTAIQMFRKYWVEEYMILLD